MRCRLSSSLFLLRTEECVYTNTVLHAHNSSSSSIFVSRLVVGIFPSELPRSFWAPISACPKLFRTLSSKPGRDALCFLKGDAMLDSGPDSGAFALAVDEDASVVVMPGTGVPERGEPEASDAVAAAGRPKGSAECWRFSY